MRKPTATIFFLILTPVLRAQFTFNAYLGTARNDIDLSDINEKLGYLNTNRIGPPAINRMEFRMQSRDLNISPEDFRLRLTPTNPGEFSSNRVYQNAEINSLDKDYQFTLNNALIIRYKLIVNYLFYRERINIADQELQMLQDDLTIIKGKGEFEQLDATALVDSERKKTETQIEKTEFESRLKKAEVAIRGLYEFQGDINLTFDQLTGIESLNSMVLQFSQATDSANIYLAREQSKLDLKESKYKVDLSESFRNIGFLQANYRRFKGTSINDRLGLEIGIRIPITDPDKADNQRAYLNLIGDREDMTKREKWLFHEQQVSLINVLASIEKYEIVNAKIEELFPGNSLDLYKKQMNKNPDKLLQIKNDQIRMRLSRLEYLQEAYSNYIDFLDVYGKLAETPLKNYLLPGLDEY